MSKMMNDGKYTFEVVKEFPNGYKIWPIGRENFNHECYIPLCEVDKLHHVNVATLKALRVQDETLALTLLHEAVKRGVNKNKYNKMIKA